jgi:allophanate hydrolase subunit 2
VIEVRSWGIATSIQDGGRTGLAHLGRSRGGAVDVHSLALANRLVGNPEHTGAFETSGGLVVTTTAAVVVAVAGAMVDGDLGWGAPVALAAGTTVRIGAVRDGARAYVAVRGGVAADGSIGRDPGTPLASENAVPRPPETVLDVWPGPRQDWVEGDLAGEWTVTATSRVGVRLAGPSLTRTRSGELPSEGLVEGAIQVPPDGQPIVMLADHPTATR